MHKQIILILSFTHTVPSIVIQLSDSLRDSYKVERQKRYEVEWPPHQPSTIVNLALIHHKRKRTQQELLEISRRCKEGASCVDELTSYSNVTTDIKDLFKPDAKSDKPPRFILIEGAPGIGKTVLAKEIAYLWATNEILTECKLIFLLYLKDRSVHEVKYVNEIFELFTEKLLTEEESFELQKFVNESHGINIAFVFDGYDEYPVALQKGSFIIDLIYGKKKMMYINSTIVVTSRPTATLFLHNIADRRIEILGFPREERNKYISLCLDSTGNSKSSLEETSEDELLVADLTPPLAKKLKRDKNSLVKDLTPPLVKKLKRDKNSLVKVEEFGLYLKRHPLINNLCYIPLYLAILIYLFQQDSLPETLTEMNESFIINTVYRYLQRNKLSAPNVMKKLKDLPEDIYEFIINKLSQLAFKGLQDNKLVFTIDEIKEVCPEVDNKVGAIDGFGLLQAIQHYPKGGAGETTSVNFLHFTMQEYLAALYMSKLSPWEQSFWMKKTFWEGQFSFMWMMHVGIVGVKSNTFASFIATEHSESHLHDTHSTHDVTDTDGGHGIIDIDGIYPFNLVDNNSDIRSLKRMHCISDSIYNDKRKCLYLFQCYM